MKVLLLEDEEAIRSFVVLNLKRAGYTVLEAGSGEEALELFEKNLDTDIMLIDLMLPGMSGMEVLKQVRRKSQSVGVIILTARSQENDKVTGFLMGADDYITKPFSPSELVARVDALQRRIRLAFAAARSEVIESGQFKLDIGRRQLFKNGVPIELTHVEFMMLRYLMENSDFALTREDIFRHVWGSGYSSDLKIVDVNIRRLRTKIEDNPSSPTNLITVWGLGYKWGGYG